MRQVLYLLFCISILLYVFAPNKYDLFYNILLGVMFVVTVLCYYSYKKKDNYFDFDTLFLLSFAVTFFVYPIFLYPINPEYFVMFSFDFNHNVITQSTALSYMGATSYMIGNISFKEKVVSLVRHHTNYSLQLYTNLAVICFVLFVLAGGYVWYANGYDEIETTATNGIFSDFLILTKVFALIATVVMFYRMCTNLHGKVKISNLYKPLLIFIIFYVLIMFSTGARGAALNILLVFGSLYSYYYHKVKFVPFAICAFCGAIVLALIGLFRVEGDANDMSFINIFMDLIICVRNNFEAIDIVEQNGISYGKSMLASLLRIVPFLSGIVHSAFDLSIWETASSTLITARTLGIGSSLGLGTSIIADIYLAFGALGVVLFMLVLGRFIHHLEYKMKCKSIYYILIYENMIAFSIFLNRGEFFFPAGQITTCLILFYFINKFSTKRRLIS